MKIAIDCDGVLRDLHSKMCEVYNRKSKELSHLHKHFEDIDQWDLKASFPQVDPDEFFFREHVGEVYIDSERTDLLAIEFVQTFKPDILSLQPTPTRKFLTRVWLYNNHFKDANYFPFKTEEEKVKAYLTYDIVIDDCKHVLKELPVAKAICFDRPWNQDYLGLRVRDFEELTQLIERMSK